jgi:hypothetical protein
MSSGLIFLVPLLAVAATLVVVLLAVPRRRALVAVNETDFPDLAHLRRSALRTRLVALVLGLIVAVPVATFGRLGQGLVLVPAVFAAIQVLGVLTGDLVGRHDARTPGSAGLEVRRARDLLPARLTLLTTLVAGALAVLLTWATVTASPDDLGRAGRRLSYTCAEDCTSAALGPWPGSFYSIPMALALLGVAAIAALAVLVTVRRPRNGSDVEILRVDDAVRRRSVESVVASLGIAVSASLAGTGLVAGLGLVGESRAPLGLQLAGWVALAAGLAALAVLAWCSVLLAVPGGPVAAESHGMPFATHGRGRQG